MDLMKTVPELEKDYLEAIRNFDVETISLIETSPNYPPQKRGFTKFEHAYLLYWQIQAFKGDPRVIMYHPV